MTNEIELKKAIARMYYAMSRVCNRHCEFIENDTSNYVISDLKQGYELETEDGEKYQLILELKKVSE